jgi:hypothetical protein
MRRTPSCGRSSFCHDGAAPQSCLACADGTSRRVGLGSRTGAPEAGFLKAANTGAAFEHFVESAGRHHDLGKRVEHARQEAKPSQNHRRRYIERKLGRADWRGSAPPPGEDRHRRPFSRIGRRGIPNEVSKQHVDERRAKAWRRDEQRHFAAGNGVADSARVLRPSGVL